MKQVIRMSEWLEGCRNSPPKKVFGKDWNLDHELPITKPCHDTSWCPYGPLVEAFPLQHPRDPEISCKIYGHDCPVFYCAEPLGEGIQTSEESAEVAG